MLGEMPPKKSPEPKLTQCNVRMPPPAIEYLDAWAAELNKEAGWAKHTRSDVMRDIVLAAIEERKAAGKRKR